MTREELCEALRVRVRRHVQLATLLQRAQDDFQRTRPLMLDPSEGLMLLALLRLRTEAVVGRDEQGLFHVLLGTADPRTLQSDTPRFTAPTAAVALAMALLSLDWRADDPPISA